jgi:uncharacterized protein (DUF433 family)
VATQQISAENFILNLDPRAMPRYTTGEAACYLGIPKSTAIAWFYGMPYTVRGVRKWYAPLLTPASDDLLSFYDLASAHVLLALKKKNVKPEDLRVIVNEVRVDSRFDPRYPLLGRNFFLFGKKKVTAVIKNRGKRITLSRRGAQFGIKEVMDKFLSRLDLDKDKMPIRLRPLRSISERGRGFIVIDPTVATGRPVVRGTGIVAEIIAKRNKSGESIASLAMDYRISPRAVKEAIKYYPTEKAA